jgi:hypothetical protein
MLIKLLRYELKAAGRILLPLYGLLLLSALVNGLFWDKNSIFSSLLLIASFLLFFAISIITFMLTIQRFWNNLLKDEGYLMFTLPVGAYTLVAAKTISALIWIVLGSITACAASLAWFLLSYGAGEIQRLADILRWFLAILDFDLSPLIAWYPLAMLASVLQWVLLLFACMSFGQTFNRHRAGAAFGSYFLVSFVQQLLTGIISTLLINASGLLTSDSTGEIFIKTFYVTSSFQLLFAALYFFLSGWLLRHKLNLE